MKKTFRPTIVKSNVKIYTYLHEYCIVSMTEAAMRSAIARAVEAAT